MFRLSGKRSGDVVAVADIGSGSVGVAIVQISHNGPAQVLVAKESSLPSGERASEAVANGVVSLLSETAQKTLDSYAKATKKVKHVSSAYAVIHSPWTRSKTIRVASTFPQETRIEKAMIDNLARQALEADTEYDRNKILEGSVIRIELNGYPTLHPVGKKGHHLAAYALLSECEPQIREGVSGALARVFACPPPILRSDTRALLTVIRESASLPKESLIVNMGAEASNIVVVRKGVVTETTLVQEGIHSIVRRIAGEKMPEETRSLIRLLALDQCEAEACGAIQEAIARAEPDLAKTFGDVFAKLSATRRLPNSLMLLTHKDLGPWLAKFFTRIDFAQFTLTTRPFVPDVLTPEDLSGLITFDEHNASSDVGLGIAAALVNMEKHAH